jgi:hypothetical protein
MKPMPLPCLTVSEATEAQHRLVDLATQHLGQAFLNGGDLGLVPSLGRPTVTAAAERVLAGFFGAEDCALVRGAGTGAIRAMLMATVEPAATLVIHDAPVYPTTAVTARGMGLNLIPTDFHNSNAIQATRGSAVLIQHARQRLTDWYAMADVITAVRGADPTALIVTDECYTAMRVPAIGVELGADYSAFSLFKLLGPEGVGCVVGRRSGIERIRRDMYSGGTQVQGHEALEVIRALVMAPVMLALQAQVTDQVAAAINRGEVPGAREAFVTNGQARVAIVLLEQPSAAEVIAEAGRLGAATRPVGAESRYEVVPLFYRVSHTFVTDRPDLAAHAIRINPMRAGAGTVLRLLSTALDAVTG